MKHFGDITKLSGFDLPPVDVITGGSPCQDLSVAGKRAGLDGERSGLFMDQVRIVKEMRQADVLRGRSGQFVRPRYMVWENVPGAFSSGKPKGADFAAVIEEIIKVCEEGAGVSVCVPDGGWTKSGCYYAEDGSWSIAWRVHDAQFWGVPQRRKRIALVADFGGLSAPEILFERKGLSRDPEPSGTARERTAGATGGGVEGASGYGETGVGYWQPGIQTLRAEGENRPSRPSNVVVQGVDGAEPILLESNQNHATVQTDGISTALPASMGMGGGYVPMVTACGVSLSANCSGTEPTVYDARGNGDSEPLCIEMTSTKNTVVEDGISPTLTARMGTGGNQVNAVCIGNGQLNQMSMAEQANTLDTMHDQQAVMVFDKEMYNCGNRMQGEPQARFDSVAPTVRADTHPSGVCISTVRRLTPMECERLQGFPDGWTDIGEWTDTKGKKHKPADSPRYKALGNSIALPFWEYLARRICAQYERPVTMGSLFDGIGGFPLAFERCGAKAVWASEIEEFPIAVTKRHFPEGGEKKNAQD